MDDRHCDWKGRCGRKPYAEVFPFRLDEHDDWAPGSGYGWSYLCRRHLLWVRMRTWVCRHVLGVPIGLGWGRAETTEEYLARLKEEETWE